MYNNEKKITVVTTSYNSGSHLTRLFKNIIDKAKGKDAIRFLIIDNTNGYDKDLANVFEANDGVEIVLNKGYGLQRSISHANALDIGLKKSQTEYTLIIDPDVHIFKPEWDKVCVEQFNNGDNVIVGAPYPQWKLGKVHDYPSVIFMFFKTSEIKFFNKSFYPFPSTYYILVNSILRKITRLGFLANKPRLDRFKFLRLLSNFLESTIGISSPDTGNQIINSLRKNKFKPINFVSPYSSELDYNDYYFKLAKEYELFFYKKEPFLTHMYGSGVMHWKTDKGSNVDYWTSLIEKVEINA